AEGWTGGEAYWRPREPDPPAGADVTLHALAARLRDALRESVVSATAESDRAAALLSGGEDSRVVLAAVPEGVDVRGVVFAEWESREVRIARRVARAHGATAARATRSPDHYATGFPAASRLTGSGHLFVDVHGLGLATDPPLGAEPVVLGGLSADSILKGGYAPEPAGRFRSKRPAGIRAELLDAVDERRNRALDRMREWRPQSAEEWVWLWPFSMRKHSGNVEGNRRVFRSWEAFHAAGVLDVAAAAPLAWKRDRRLFRTAMRPLLRRTAWIPHTEYRFPYLGPWGNALALPGLAAARGARALATGECRVRHRPWPKWRALAASDAMRAHEAALPVAGTPLAAIFDRDDPAAVAAARAEWYALRRLLLTQLAYVLRVHAG
ncbi:MAG: asparagine synthase-related protein, partial [Gemmatimonadota bacterium]